MKIILKSKSIPGGKSSTLPFSDVVKNATNNDSQSLSQKISHHRSNSPKLFLVVMAAILIIFISLIGGFLWVQSQGATNANIYRSKTGDYLEKVYNAATIKTDNPSDTAAAISKIEAPVLGNSSFGWLSYSYLSAELLQRDIKSNIDKLTDEVRSNGNFYDFYNSYVDALAGVGALYDQVNSANIATKSAAYLQVRDKYLAIKSLAEQVKLPDELSKSQNTMVDKLGKVAEAWGNMSTALSSGDKSAFAKNSYLYALSYDDLAKAFSAMTSYSDNIKNRLAAAAEDFNKFRLSL